MYVFGSVASLGTTNVGAMDHLDELTEVGRDYPGLWIHIDAAWAGVYLALPEHRAKLYLEIINRPEQDFKLLNVMEMMSSDLSQEKAEWIEEELKLSLKISPGLVHSFCTNFHKSGLVSFDCSTFFIRHKACLNQAMELTPHYLKSKQGDSGQCVH